MISPVDVLWWACALAAAGVLVFFAVFCFACTVMVIRHVIEEFKTSQKDKNETGVSVLPDEELSADGLLVPL